MRRVHFSIVFVFIAMITVLLLSVAASPVMNYLSVPPDSLRSSEFIKRQIVYQKTYSFIDYESNFIEWADSSSILPFFRKLGQSPQHKLRILHIGDSHVQADLYTGSVRNYMQNLFGVGGRGFMFPYSAAGTHSAYDYKTTAKGSWMYARNISLSPAFNMGISGATVHTTDTSAGFTITLNRLVTRDNYTSLKIYCKFDSASFDLKLQTPTVQIPLYLDCRKQHTAGYIEIQIPQPCDTLQFSITRSDTTQRFFECYGMVLETNTDQGVLYSSVGINGAGYSSILQERLLPDQLTSYNPDLVVIDLGANDFYPGEFKPDIIEPRLSAIIDLVRKSAPDACILICNSQDLYRKKKNITGCADFSQSTRRVAFAKNCALWDYYHISGGPRSMLKWLSTGLARRDRVHLSAQGYYTKGELLYNAFLNSYYLYLTKDSLQKNIMGMYSADTNGLYINLNKKIELPDSVRQDEDLKPEYVNYASNADKVVYTIKPGDNLGSIAQKYGVTVSNLKGWNGLRSDRIVAGDKLIIFTKKKPKDSGSTVKKTNTTTGVNTNNKGKTTPGKKINYTVANGDNLWIIAKKFNVTVESIRQANKLTSDKLQPGKVLVIIK